MKRLIGYTAALCLLALMVGCGGVTSTGTLAYVSNSSSTAGTTGFTVFNVNTDATLTKSSISPQNTPASPKVLQFAANGKWAYFLDASGQNIYGYVRAGNGTLTTQIDVVHLNHAASSLVISPNSTFIYVALQSSAQLSIFSLDPATGVPSQVQSDFSIGYNLSQLVLGPGGSVLYGLSPSQGAIVSFGLNPNSGVTTSQDNFSVSPHPDYMILSADGKYIYVLDQSATTPIFNVTVTNGVPVQTLAGNSPNIYGFNVAGSKLTPMPGTSSGGFNVFNENPDPVTGYPSIPFAGATSNDTRYLFVANQGSQNISIFKINPTSGVLNEILNTLSVVNGVPVTTGSPFTCGPLCTTPSFVAVSVANNGLYVLDNAANKIFQFKIDQNNGTLRAQNPAFVGAEGSPTWITFR